MFNRLFSRLRGQQPLPEWPAGVPNLYPQLDGPALCDFLTQQEFKRIRKFPKLMICPLIDSQQEDSVKRWAGAGLSRLLIRDLMLLTNVSVRGPEDTYKSSVEDMREHVASTDCEQTTIFMLGQFKQEHGYCLEYEFWRGGKKLGGTRVTDSRWENLILKCATKVAKSLRAKVTPEILKQWEVARPTTLISLAHLGMLDVGYGPDDTAEKSKLVRLALQHDPNFAMLMTEYPGDDNLSWLLKAFELDPYDAQTCFSLFISIWQSKGVFEPAAVQFLRRAIELSPGHGKAHMCAPHAAHEAVVKKMITHSELGYRLLPNNPFAISNYINNLILAGASEEKMLALCREGIASDSSDPANYDRMIELFTQLGNHSTALFVAEELQKLYEPEMNPRALYCLNQNPQRKALIESGQYDPVVENRRRIAELRKLCR